MHGNVLAHRRMKVVVGPLFFAHNHIKTRSRMHAHASLQQLLYGRIWLPTSGLSHTLRMREQRFIWFTTYLTGQTLHVQGTSFLPGLTCVVQVIYYSSNDVTNVLLAYIK